MTPAILISMIYAAGIIFGRSFHVPAQLLLVAAFVCLSASVCLLRNGQKPVYLVLLIIFILGLFAFHSASAHLNDSLAPAPSNTLISALKDRLLSVIDRTMEKPYSLLLGSVIFGDQASPLPYDLKQNYKTAGVIHLLVVSGTQVAIIISLISAVCGCTGLPPILRLGIVTFANVIFTIMTGAGPSIIRAAVMAEAALIAKYLDRNNGFYNSLAVSALFILIASPLSLFDIGFQLSFLATWALFYVAPVLEERLSEHIPKKLSAALSISVGPTIATSPVILYNFGQVSFVSVISNFLIVPWIEAAVILGFASTLIGQMFLPVAHAINNFLTIMLFLLNSLVSFFAGLPFAAAYFAPPGLLCIACYYIILIGGLEAMRGKLRFDLRAALILFAVFIFSSITFAGSGLKVTVMDVGQGDAILIEAPDGSKMLIDGGDYRSGVASKLRKKGVNKLDVVVLTHPHGDHVDGLLDVLSKFKVDSVIDSGQGTDNKAYRNFLELVRKNKIKYGIVRAGRMIELGGIATFEVLSPFQPFIKGKGSELNNNSIVMRLIYGNTAFLFTGDIENAGEDRIMAAGFDLKSDILKVAHHGSKYSSSQAFLAAVRPRFAAISVGADNKFGHPDASTVEKLEDCGARVLRTDDCGDITFRSDGRTVRPVGN